MTISMLVQPIAPRPTALIWFRNASRRFLVAPARAGAGSAAPNRDFDNGPKVAKAKKPLQRRALVCVLPFLALHPAWAAEKFNLLLVCVDDLKPALGCYGDKLAQSPNIDRLAARAVQFGAAYCNQAVCAPSRNALLTGLRPQTLGIYDLGTNFRRSRPDAVTLPQFFRQHGWRTEGLGKIFHTGHGNADDPASWSVPRWRVKNKTAAPMADAAQEAITPDMPAPGGASAPEFLPVGPFKSGEVPDNVYADGAVADEAINRLKAAKNKPEEPFFLAVGFVKPHLPFIAPKKYWDLYDRAAFRLAEVRTPPVGAPGYAPQFGDELRSMAGIPKTGPLPDELQRALLHGYYAATSYMDAQLGRVLDELDRLGLARNTIIVVWGDHGWHLGDHGMWCKHTNYEQATRTPLLVAVPGARAGAKTAALVESVDIFPTLCELAGLTTPAGTDGRSFAATLRDPSAPTKDHIIHVYPRGELLGRAIRTARHRLVEWKKPGAPATTAEFELYDYAADPLETKNIAAELPTVTAQLRALLATHPEAKPDIRALRGRPATSTPPPASKLN